MTQEDIKKRVLKEFEYKFPEELYESYEAFRKDQNVKPYIRGFISQALDTAFRKWSSEAKVTGETSDGYHTFNELYEHRIVLFCALGRAILDNEYSRLIPWKSKKHSDGTVWDGWFIAGIGNKKGEQISYHIPIDKWRDFSDFRTRAKAPDWDGHTPQDVLERLKKLQELGE